MRIQQCHLPTLLRKVLILEPKKNEKSATPLSLSSLSRHNDFKCILVADSMFCSSATYSKNTILWHLKSNKDDPLRIYCNKTFDRRPSGDKVCAFSKNLQLFRQNWASAPSAPQAVSPRKDCFVTCTFCLLNCAHFSQSNKSDNCFGCR